MLLATLTGRILIRAGNTRSLAELGSIFSRCSGDKPAFSPTILKHRTGESEEIELSVESECWANSVYVSYQSFITRLEFELTNQNSAGGKNLTVLTSMYVTLRHCGNFFLTRDGTEYSLKGIYSNSKNHTRLEKSETYDTSYSKLLIWCQKMGRPVRQLIRSSSRVVR